MKHITSRDEQLKEIMEKLEAGVDELFSSEKFQEYLDTMSKFYNYSVNNCILIAMQRPDATRVAGYRAWQQKFGRQVKKGEKAIKIIAPIPRSFKKEVKNADGTAEEKDIKFMSYRVTSVFDISQTEGKELPSIAVEMLSDPGAEHRCERLFNRIARLAPVPVEFKEIEGGCKGYFSPSGMKIVIKEGMTNVQSLKTLVHEVAHSLMHGKGCKYEASDARTKEVQAESVAYVVCARLGIDTSEYSFGYVAGWSKSRDKSELVESLEAIRKTAGVIIDAVEGKQELKEEVA